MFGVHPKRAFSILEDLVAAGEYKRIELGQFDGKFGLAASESQSVAFAHVDQKITAASRIVTEWMSLTTIVTGHFPAYRPGESLSGQVGSEHFRAKLRAAVEVLVAIDLIDAELAEARFAHTTALLLIKWVLRTQDASVASDFIDDPARFFASALAAAHTNSVGEIQQQIVEKRIRGALKRAGIGVHLTSTRLVSDRAQTVLKFDSPSAETLLSWLAGQESAPLRFAYEGRLALNWIVNVGSRLLSWPVKVQALILASAPILVVFGATTAVAQVAPENGSAAQIFFLGIVGVVTTGWIGWVSVTLVSLLQSRSSNRDSDERTKTLLSDATETLKEFNRNNND